MDQDKTEIDASFLHGQYVWYEIYEHMVNRCGLHRKIKKIMTSAA